MTSSTDLLAEVRDVLRERCLLGVSLNLAPVSIRLVTAAVEVGVARREQITVVEQQVRDALYEFINPYVGGDPLQPTRGWRWGRSLHAGELAPVVRRIPGVQSLRFVRIYAVDHGTGLPAPHQLDEGLLIGPDELLASGEHRVHAVVAATV